MTRIAFFAAAALAPAVALAQAAPLAADVSSGERTYRLHCTACHGVAAAGDGPLAAGLKPKPSNLRDGASLFARGDDEWLSVALGQAGKAQAFHGRGLTALDARDVLAWIREPVPSIGSLFPTASHYIAHRHALDTDAIGRAEAVVGKLDESEKALMVFTVFKQGDAPVGNPARVQETPQALYEMQPKMKLGYVAYLPLKTDGGTFDAVMALDRTRRLVAAQTLPVADERLESQRRKAQGIIDGFIGAGGRGAEGEKRPIEPQTKGVKAPKELQSAMLRAYTLVLEGAAMYDLEERNRFWADPDAYKMPSANDQPDETKFEIKLKK